MSRHDDTVYLRHMRDHACAALEFTRGKQRASLDAEPVLRYALLHLVCVLGEAANRVSDERKSRLNTIPWRGMVGMRNALIHGYDTVDLDRLWITVEIELPRLITALDTEISGSENPGV